MKARMHIERFSDGRILYTSAELDRSSKEANEKDFFTYFKTVDTALRSDEQGYIHFTDEDGDTVIVPNIVLKQCIVTFENVKD